MSMLVIGNDLQKFEGEKGQEVAHWLILDLASEDALKAVRGESSLDRPDSGRVKPGHAMSRSGDSHYRSFDGNWRSIGEGISD